MTKVLAGIKVLEVAGWGFVPAAGAVLSEWGAEVTKIEHPEHGDPVRGLAVWGIRPGTGGFNFFWEVCNRGKRSVGIDMASDRGRDLALELADRSDVFLTSLMQPAREKLGIDVEAVMSRNPKIVYARGSGQGPAGPDANKGGYDASSYWHRTGIGAAASAPGATEPAGLPGPGFGDVQSGVALAGGIAAALVHRERTGAGTVVDSSLFANGLWAMQPASVGAQTLDGDRLSASSSHDLAANPLANSYRTLDGRFVMLVMLDSDRHWGSFCRALDRPDLHDDQRYADEQSRRAHRAELIPALDREFSSRPLDEWVQVLASQTGAWSIVQTPLEGLRDPQAVANGYVRRVDYGAGRSLDLVAAPTQFDQTHVELRPAPDLGEHTDAILQELGHDWGEIIELKVAGVVN